MHETDQSPTTMEHELWNTNGGNLIVESSLVVDDQDWSKKSRSSSSSSSSDSLLDIPFGEDEDVRNTKSENFMMESSHAAGGVDVQVSSKKLSSFSSSSSSPDSSLDGPFGEEDEKHGKRDHGNLTVKSSPAIGGVDDKVCRNTSRSSSSSSSSPDSLQDGNFWDGNEEHKNTNGVNLMMQSSHSFDGIEVQTSSKMSRSSSSSSSPVSSLNAKGDDKKDRNTNGINLMMQSSHAVHVLDVQAPSRMSRSSSTSSSSPDSSLNGPFKKDDEQGRKTNTGNLVMQSSPAVDQVDVQVSSKKLRSASSSSSSSSSSPDSPLNDHGFNNEAKIENGKAKEPATTNSLPTDELPVSISPAEDKNNSPESNIANMPATDSPPIQAMERPTNSKYRIPSHVFARTKSNNPVDWSVASNESLFSIHMGNTSFTSDQLFLRPEVLGTIPGESSTSGQMFNYSTCALPGESSTPGQMFNYSTNQPPGSNATDGKSHELAVETVKEVPKEIPKENEDQIHEKRIAEGRISHQSAGSSASTKSFAFPILTDLEKGHSVSISIDGSSRLCRENQEIGSQNLSTPKTPSQPLEQPKLKDPPAGTQFGFGIRWLSCMSCCTFCR